MDYQILVLDIDGTLTNSRKEITQSTLKALINLQERGYKVVLASGRPTPGIMALARMLNLEKYGSYILSYNGAKIINCKTMETIYQKTLPKSVIPTLYELAVENHTGIVTYEMETVIAGTKIDEYMQKEADLNHMPIKYVENFSEYVSFDVNKCLLTADPAHLAEVENVFKKKFNQYLNIYRSEPYFLEIMPQNIDKAHSLLKLLGSLGLTSDQMVCCGDGFNDISMIECAGLGVAMENAQSIVKNAADYITSSNDSDGIVQVIENFFPSSKTAGNEKSLKTDSTISRGF